MIKILARLDWHMEINRGICYLPKYLFQMCLKAISQQTAKVLKKNSQLTKLSTSTTCLESATPIYRIWLPSRSPPSTFALQGDGCGYPSFLDTWPLITPWECLGIAWGLATTGTPLIPGKYAMFGYSTCTELVDDQITWGIAILFSFENYT